MIDALGALHARFGAARAGRRLLPGGVRRRPAPASTGCYDELEVVAGDRDARPAAGDVRRAVATSWATVAVPGAAGAERRAVGGLAARTTAGPREELKVRNESRKILGLPELQVPRPACGCRSSPRTRWPCTPRFERRGHRRRGRAQVLVEAPRAWCVRRRPGEPASSRPRPTSSAPTRPGWAGCARRWTTRTTLELFVCGDNLRKGAALNTAQIAELVAAEFTGRDA